MRRFFYRVFFATWTSLPRVVRHHFWRLMYRIGRKFWTDPTPGAQQIPFGLFLKRGWKARIQEGYATQFVGQVTDIPVPTVIDILDYRGQVVLVLSALPGDSLASLLREMSEEQKLHVGEQLRGYLSQLRAVPPPSGAVSGFGANPLYDDRISMGLHPFGPFTSVAEFHRFLVEHSVLEVPPENQDDVLGRISLAHSRPHRICLTHGDLHPHNILVDERYNISGIIDWECTGWLPEYWSVWLPFTYFGLTFNIQNLREYTRAQYLPWFRKGRWHRMITLALPGYDVEYEVEQLIWRYRLMYA